MGKNDLFSVVIIMKQMLTKDEFRDFLNEVSYEIDTLDGKINVIPIENILNKIGFPKNYREIMDVD